MFCGTEVPLHCAVSLTQVRLSVAPYFCPKLYDILARSIRVAGGNRMKRSMAFAVTYQSGMQHKLGRGQDGVSSEFESVGFPTFDEARHSDTEVTSRVFGNEG